ncbi:MAG: hypothetical protein NTV08_01645 [Verrucomicrobia bacterium]|nr:hypothetical protein [Verrucomicrobiota bacterium]
MVSDGRVIVGLVWHRDVPSETRQIGELVLRQLGHQSVKSLGKELVEKIEKARESLPPTLRGKKLEEFAQKFAEENFDAKQRQLYTGWITKRFTKGKVAWQTQTQTTICSPLIADGNLFAMANNGNSLLMISTDPKAYTSLGCATVKAQWVPSPSIANVKLVLRMKDKVKAWALTP